MVEDAYQSNTAIRILKTEELRTNRAKQLGLPSDATWIQIGKRASELDGDGLLSVSDALQITSEAGRYS
jgi:hypothetical protein